MIKKLFSIKRITTMEGRYHRNMGCISTKVTRIQKAFIGIPYKTLHKYRETYHGKVKDCHECDLSKI
tara:strand:+ start:876 stop:1076 length:201 start_codon:yes stop_codon:yes gene_type:complete